MGPFVNRKKVDLHVIVAEVVPGHWISTVTLGGISFRSHPSSTAIAAFTSLMMEVCNPTGDGTLAVALAMADETIQMALESGEDIGRDSTGE